MFYKKILFQSFYFKSSHLIPCYLLFLCNYLWKLLGILWLKIVSTPFSFCVDQTWFYTEQMWASHVSSVCNSYLKTTWNRNGPSLLALIHALDLDFHHNEWHLFPLMGFSCGFICRCEWNTKTLVANNKSFWNTSSRSAINWCFNNFLEVAKKMHSNNWP